MVENCQIRQMVIADLERVLAWRNQPQVRRYMLTQHEITLVEHQHWFEHNSQDPTRRLMIVEEGGMALGFVHFIGVESWRIADWGFYVAPRVPRGSGSKLGMTALNFAFKVLGLHKVCGQVLAFNEASISLHLKLGFKLEGVLRQHHQIDGSFYDLISFGLLCNEWPGEN